MKEYELVHEIKNQCPNNQMRDIFFSEVECDDPETYVRRMLKGKTLELSTEPGQDGPPWYRAQRRSCRHRSGKNGTC